MTVQQLIKELKKYPSNARVVVTTHENEGDNVTPHEFEVHGSESWYHKKPGDLVHINVDLDRSLDIHMH